MNKLEKIGNVVKGLLFGQQSQYVVPIAPNEYGNNILDNIFFGNDGVEYQFTYEGHHSSLKAYQQCPPLTAIINRKAQAHINGRTYIMNTQGKEASSPQAKLIKNLFSNPNPLQSQKQFEAQQKIYMQLFGYCIVFFMKPTGFKDNIDAKWMWNIPPNMIDIKETNKLFYQTDITGIIGEVVLTYKGQRSTLKVQDLYIFKDFTPSMSSLIIPESRVCALRMPINNIIGAYESRNVLINNRGALGIISPESRDGIGSSVPMREEDKVALQNDYRRYGLRKGQWQAIISNAAVKWEQIGIPTRDLLLIEEVQESSKEVCHGYGYPPFLVGLADTTYSNQESAAKSLYENTIVPESDSIYEEWTNCFKAQDYNLSIVKDYAHLPVLQADKQKEAMARKTLGEELRAEFYANTITYNRMLELLNEDTRPGYDKYYTDLVAEGMVFTLPQTQQNGTGQQQTTQPAA